MLYDTNFKLKLNIKQNIIYQQSRDVMKQITILNFTFVNGKWDLYT